MAIKTAEDKAKVCTAIKCYLSFKGSATAKQLATYLNEIDLKLRANINPTVIGNELLYCAKTKGNFLRVGYDYEPSGERRYFLED